MSHLLKATEDGPEQEPWSMLTAYVTAVTGTFSVTPFVNWVFICLHSNYIWLFDKCVTVGENVMSYLNNSSWHRRVNKWFKCGFKKVTKCLSTINTRFVFLSLFLFVLVFYSSHSPFVSSCKYDIYFIGLFLLIKSTGLLLLQHMQNVAGEQRWPLVTPSC